MLVSRWIATTRIYKGHNDGTFDQTRMMKLLYQIPNPGESLVIVCV